MKRGAKIKAPSMFATPFRRFTTAVHYCSSPGGTAVTKDLHLVAKTKAFLDFCNPFQFFHHFSSPEGTAVIQNLKGVANIKAPLIFSDPFQVVYCCSSLLQFPRRNCSSKKLARGCKNQGRVDFCPPFQAVYYCSSLLQFPRRNCSSKNPARGCKNQGPP